MATAKTSKKKNIRAEGDIAQTTYDVIVVGAGPVGATTAYYLATGASPLSVGLLDKATFPRDKYCGDAWCAPALTIMEDMGVLQQLEAEGLINVTSAGGFVSPYGQSYMSGGPSASQTLIENRTYAIKRIICDERIARRAAEVGATLHEKASVSKAKLEGDGLWTVSCEDGRIFRSRMLVAADGAASRLARDLGVVTTPPKGVAARQYVQGGTHNYKSGGVLLFPKYILPGYVALFRHYDDSIDLGCYIIPGGAAQPEEVLEIYDEKIKKDPFVMRVLGPNPVYLERVKTASLRMGGVSKSYANQFLAVGDAAGQTDPLTGEGIHTGMIAGQLAAKTIHELFERQDFSEAACKIYQKRWMDDFGRDFKASALGAKMIYRFPYFMDAANKMAQRKGDEFIADFGAVMTGVKPKTTFLRPKLALPLMREVGKQYFKQQIKKPFASEEDAYNAMGTWEATNRESAFCNTCLRDKSISVEMVAQKWEEAAQAEGGGLEEAFQFASDEPKARRALVMYGTEYGFSKEAAHQLGQQLSEKQAEETPLSIRVLNLNAHEIVDWEQTDVCLFICSTAGDGIPPIEAKPFFKFLKETSPNLTHLKVAVLAPGDSSYPHYCRAGKTLESLLTQCGAVSLIKRVEMDQEDPGVVQGWLNAVTNKVVASQTWEDCPVRDQEDYLYDAARTYFEAHGEGATRPTRNSPFYSRIVKKELLTQLVEDGDRETVHIEIDILNDEGEPMLQWEPGDALGVIPKNAMEDVNAVLKALPGSGEDIIEVKASRTSLQEVLISEYDIKNISSDLLQFLIEGATGADEKKLAKSLQAPSKNGSGTAMSAYIKDREVQDVLKAFPSSAQKLTAKALVSRLKRIQPRYYSISSSPLENQGTLSIAVAAVRYKTHGLDRIGLASTYLIDRVEFGDLLPVFVQKNPEFRLPSDANSSYVMIGPGTGVAPYRAFLQHQRQNGTPVSASPSVLKNGSTPMLFFGCRHEDRDFLYSDEWHHQEEQGNLKLITAFSRQTSKKVYVQNRMMEQGSELWQRMERGDHFYLCGDATQMAGDVEHTLLDIIRSHGDMPLKDAKTFLETMESEGRYQKDVWA